MGKLTIDNLSKMIQDYTKGDPKKVKEFADYCGVSIDYIEGVISKSIKDIPFSFAFKALEKTNQKLFYSINKK